MVDCATRVERKLEFFLSIIVLIFVKLAIILILLRGNSIYHPLLLSMSNDFVIDKPFSFKYFQMRVQHDGLLPLVKSSWYG